LGKNTQKFSTSGCCFPEIEVPFFLFVLIPGIVICYSKVDQFPSIYIRKLFNLRVLLLENYQFPRNNPRKFDNFQLPGNITRKLTERPNCWANFRITIPQNFPFPSIVTRKLIKFRITIPGYCPISEIVQYFRKY